MLNEVFALERGLSAAGFDVAPRHPDVSSPGRTDALQVRLDKHGMPTEAAPLGRDRVAVLWTLRNGKHNSFPYVQLKQPLLSVPDGDNWRKAHNEAWKPLAPRGRRRMLRDLARDYPASSEATAALVARGLRDSLGKRRNALAQLEEPHASVAAVIERVLAIESAARFANALLTLLLAELDEADDVLLEAAHTLLTGRMVQGKIVGSPLLFDVLHGEFACDVADPRHAAAISRALSSGAAGGGAQGTCFLTGAAAALHAGNFPQPTVPILGQIYPFSKNGDIPAAYRYGCAGVAALPVSSDLVQRLAGALDAITAPDRKGQTWRGVPGEKPEARDLLIAFVDGVPDAPVAELVAADDAEEQDDDPSAEETGHLDEDERQVLATGAARGKFQIRTKRLIEAVQGRVGAEFRDPPVAVLVLVLRKVDTGNAKAILHRALTVGRLYDAALAWAEALDNLPQWLRMPVLQRAKGKVVQQKAPSLTPLLLPRATQALFTRGGSERAKREPVGVTATDALALFLGEAGAGRIAQATLRIVLARQGVLLSGTAHALRRDAGSGELKAARDFDRGAALQAATLIGVLLAKIGRKEDTYMTEPAFQLGQLLAAADAIHVGYCMDVRGGQVPPTLLGNSVLTIAQTDPQRALAVLCRRWKPYWSWVGKTRADWNEAESAAKGQGAKDSQKGWAVRTAISQASRMRGIAEELGRNLPDTRNADDKFRAELLLGYVAGVPKNKRATEAGKQEETE